MSGATDGSTFRLYDTVTLSEARSRLDQRRFSRPNTHFSAFFKIYKKIIFSQANLQNFPKFHGILEKFEEIFRNFAKFCKSLQNFAKFHKNFAKNFTEFCKIL